ncbi:glucans biosynthesis glucosyltransferase MdoH [Halovulum sp. GXIMD14793]
MNAPFDPGNLMPPEAPLDMPEQDFHTRFRDPDAPGGGYAPWLARLFVFGLSGALTLALALIFEDWFMSGGITLTEGAVIVLVVVTFFWIALSLATALMGLLPMRARRIPGGALDVAVLMPVFGESVPELATRWRAMLDDIGRTPTQHRFFLFILSDTRDPAHAEAEAATVLQLKSDYPNHAIHYRRRVENTGFKAGNIADWVRRWGDAYPAMLVLDSDSIMSGAAIAALADALAADSNAGLIQSVPRLYGSQTIFARAQQFANTVYGSVLSRGLARWSGDDANYWGHNAIIRTRAFAACAGMPSLSGRAPFGGPVLSHDFVEAALLRRAGWHVRFLPSLEHSYETTPPTLIAHVLRDRRWCQGNLQHLRLLAVPGFRVMSRMHLFQGAMAYLMSLGWFGLLVLWVALGLAEMPEVRYFSESQPHIPIWPHMDRVAKLLILGVVYGLLIAPKLIGALRFWVSDPTLTGAGGIGRFWLSWLVEVLLSILLAPSMMIQHIIAVLRTFSGLTSGWRPAGNGYARPAVLLRFHAMELVIGAAMLVLYILGLMQVWLMPVAICLLLAPLLSGLTACSPGWARALLHTPQEVTPPAVLSGLTVEAPQRARPVRPLPVSA